MYISAPSDLVEPSSDLPAAIANAFWSATEEIDARSALLWGDHCTECAWPSCYYSCEFCNPKENLHCGRFKEGIVRVDLAHVAASDLMKGTFGIWAKLEAQAPARMYSLRDAKAFEVADAAASKMLARLSLPYAITQVLHVRRSRKQHERSRDEGRVKRDNVVPTGFYLQAYNPSSVDVAISLVIRQAKDTPLFFEDNVILVPGYQRHSVPIKLILKKIDLTERYLANNSC